MMDILPFPRIVGGTAEEQVSELYNYLIQLKEELEFALMNISADNLSPELLNKINELGANMVQNKESTVEEISQISNNASKYNFSVNFSTGDLEYL